MAESGRIVELRGKVLFDIFTPISKSSLRAFICCIGRRQTLFMRRVTAWVRLNCSVSQVGRSSLRRRFALDQNCARQVRKFFSLNFVLGGPNFAQFLAKLGRKDDIQFIQWQESKCIECTISKGWPPASLHLCNMCYILCNTSLACVMHYTPITHV